MRFRDNCRLPPICIITYTCMKWDVPEKIDLVLLTRFHYTWVRPKYVGTVVTVWASEEGHILDHSQDGNIRFFEHVNSFHGIFQSNILRCRDDNCA
jgi:hypothetical protein